MSRAWKAMMRELRSTIRKTPEKRREEMRAASSLQAMRPSELFNFSDVERTCFDECLEIYDQDHGLLEDAEFAAPVPPKKQAEDQRHLGVKARTRPAPGQEDDEESALVPSPSLPL